tara:strand:+ start:3346 stop:5424 length:2079 start_codon:yes stop_codon:yes gene_type:complete
MITYEELTKAFSSQDPEAWRRLSSRYGREEVLNSANLYDEIGEDEYRTQFSRPDLPATARESTVPYDREAGVFSTKNLNALAANFGPNALQTYEGLKAVYDDPALLGQMFTREGAAAIVDDFAEFVDDPARRIVEQPFTSMIDLAPGIKGTGALVKRAIPDDFARGLSSINEYMHLNTPKLARAIEESANVVTDPLKTTVRAGRGAVKGSLNLIDSALPYLAEVFSGVENTTVRKALDAGRLTPKQKTAAQAKPAYTPSGAAMRLIPGRLGTPNVDITPLKYFREVVKGVRDESVILRDMLNAIGEINDEMNDVFVNELPALFGNMTETFDLLPAVNKWTETLTKPLTGAKVALQQQEVQKVIKNAIRGQYEQSVPVMVPKVSIDLSQSTLRGIPDNRLEQAVDFINEHFANANNLDPKDAYKLMRNIDNLIQDVPLTGATGVQAMLADLRHHIRGQFTEMTEKLPGGKTINEKLQEVDDRMTYLSAVQKEFSLYTKGHAGGWESGEVPKNVNAGSVLKKIMTSSKHANKYRQGLAERMEARVGPLTTGLAALDMQRVLPSNLVGRGLIATALTGNVIAGTASTAAFSLLPVLALTSPRIMSRWVRWVGAPKRVADWVEEIGKGINENKTARMMADAGYTVGGILLNHGKIREAADKRYYEDQQSKKLASGAKRTEMTDFPIKKRENDGNNN